MMRQQINKKIFIYLLIFFLLGTYSNKEISKFTPKINNFEITGLNEFDHNQIQKKLAELKNKNLFFLDKNKILEIINSYKIVEKFFVFKNYPSNLNIKIEKTNFLALTKKNGLDYYVGSNGNLIEAKGQKIDLPYLFGDIEIIEFLELKKIIDNSKFDYKNIQNLYYFKSKRWDIETKDSLIIKLPSEKLEVSFEILLELLHNTKFDDPKVIDLRQKNLVILNE